MDHFARFAPLLLFVAACSTDLPPEDVTGTVASSSALASAMASASEPPEGAVLGAIGGRHGVASTDALVALGPGTPGVLARLSSDAGPRDPWVHVRALLALRAFPTSATEQFLVAYVGEEHPPACLRAALDTLSVAYGETDPGAVARASRGLVSHPDPSVARAARAALAHARVRAAVARR